MEAVTRAILDEFRRTAVALAAVPVFVFLPIEDEITLSERPPSPEERFFFRYCRDRGIQAIDLRPVFQAWLKRGVALKDVGHWDPLEHRIAAEGIHAYLLAQRLLSWAHPADPASRPTTTNHWVPFPARSALVAGGAR